MNDLKNNEMTLILFYNAFMFFLVKNGKRRTIKT